MWLGFRIAGFWGSGFRVLWLGRQGFSFFNHLFSFPHLVGNTTLVEAVARSEGGYHNGIPPPKHHTIPPLLS